MIHKFLLTVALVLIGIVQGGAQEPFTFAQITDIHLNSNDPKPLEYLMTSIDDMNQNPAIDFVLITGDLADNGDNASLEQLAKASEQEILCAHGQPRNHVERVGHGKV